MRSMWTEMVRSTMKSFTPWCAQSAKRPQRFTRQSAKWWGIKECKAITVSSEHTAVPWICFTFHEMNIFMYTQSESKLPTNITVRRCRSGGFLAVQDSSIGDLVTHSVSQWVSESVSQVTFDFWDNDKTFERLLRDFSETLLRQRFRWSTDSQRVTW